MKLDLHTHSNFSDGTLPPSEVMERAKNAGVTHISLTDHDTIDGIPEAREKAAALGLTLIPGVEINCREMSPSVHMLGYFFDEADTVFQEKLQQHRAIRRERATQILDKLQKMGIRIFLSDFIDRKGAAIGRPHIADKLKEKGIVFSRSEAFNRFLSQGRSAYVQYMGPVPEDAVKMILEAKGVPVLAHPGVNVSDSTIESLIKAGLQGIEVHYPSHSAENIRHFLEIASRNGLVVTGGSDYHGPDSGHENLGEPAVPPETIDRLLERKQKLFR